MWAYGKGAARVDVKPIREREINKQGPDCTVWEGAWDGDRMRWSSINMGTAIGKEAGEVI